MNLTSGERRHHCQHFEMPHHRERALTFVGALTDDLIQKERDTGGGTGNLIGVVTHNIVEECRHNRAAAPYSGLGDPLPLQTRGRLAVPDPRDEMDAVEGVFERGLRPTK